MDESIKAHLIELERHLLQPEVRKSAEELNKYLADRFIEFGSRGIRYTKQQIISELGAEPELEFVTSDFEIEELADDAVVLTYKVVIRRKGEAEGKKSLRSSIWRKIDGRWQMLFHQGTPISE